MFDLSVLREFGSLAVEVKRLLSMWLSKENLAAVSFPSCVVNQIRFAILVFCKQNFNVLIWSTISGLDECVCMRKWIE